jgi:hypothetical protein
LLQQSIGNIITPTSKPLLTAAPQHLLPEQAGFLQWYRVPETVAGTSPDHSPAEKVDGKDTAIT